MPTLLMLNDLMPLAIWLPVFIGLAKVAYGGAVE